MLQHCFGGTKVICLSKWSGAMKTVRLWCFAANHPSESSGCNELCVCSVRYPVLSPVQTGCSLLSLRRLGRNKQPLDKLPLAAAAQYILIRMKNEQWWGRACASSRGTVCLYAIKHARRSSCSGFYHVRLLLYYLRPAASLPIIGLFCSAAAADTELLVLILIPTFTTRIVWS